MRGSKKKDASCKRPPPGTYRSLFYKDETVEHVAPPAPKVGRRAKQPRTELAAAVDVPAPVPIPAIPESDIETDAETQAKRHIMHSFEGPMTEKQAKASETVMKKWHKQQAAAKVAVEAARREKEWRVIDGCFEPVDESGKRKCIPCSTITKAPVLLINKLHNLSKHVRQCPTHQEDQNLLDRLHMGLEEFDVPAFWHYLHGCDFEFESMLTFHLQHTL